MSDMSNKTLFTTLIASTMIVGGAYIAYRNRDEIKQKIKELSAELDKLRSENEFIDEAVAKLADLEHKVEQNLQKFSEGFEEQLTEVQKEVAEIEEQVRADVKVTKKEVTKQTEQAVSKVRSSIQDSFKLNERQEMIYRLIKEEGEAAMNEISRAIAGVTKRTLRRDVTKLEKLGLIEQLGKTKSSVYKLKA